jgi:GTP pyrophosphokinase/guanosine-3',5'-bis(diphosphate) 3'-pyrophosphohydrolase
MVHSDVGKKADFAYINGEKKSLLTILKNGDSVKIATKDKIILRCSWIDSVKTSKAKESIKQSCRAKIKEINKKTNINILSNLFYDNKQYVKDLLDKDEALIKLLSSDIESFESFKKLKSKVKQHLLNKSTFLARLKLKMITLKKRELDNFDIYSNSSISSVIYDYCCHPKISDEIVAFKNDKKVVVHHKLCDNAAKLINDGKEMVFIQWKAEQRVKYFATISLENKKGALAQYLSFLSKYNINLNTLEVGNNSNEFVSYTQMEIDTDISDINKIKSIISKKAKIIELYESKDAYKGS